ncbi:MAG: AfsR/SARP family transcriptional regulator [Gaiellaceae bacterium]
MSESRSLLRPARPSRRDAARAAAVRLYLLNGFELVADGVVASLPPGAQRVVAFVALHDRPLLRAYVAGSLWLDSPEDRAAANLRSALWRIQRVEPRLIAASDRQLRLDDEVVVDLRETEILARAVLRGEAPADESGDDLSRLAADLLPDWYDDWAFFERERFRQLRLRALEALCDQLARAGRVAEALEAGLLSVAGEPLRESAHRALMRVHLADGNPGEAIRQYRLCERLLRDQLGIEPSARMQEVLRDLDDVETIR